ncbi:MAG: hypothetical protein R2857_06485 [Vampirovibrionales bacterium]
MSQHLKLLKMNHLVEERREGRHVYYHLKNPDIIQVVMVAIELQAADHQQEGKQVALYKEMHALWATDYDDAVLGVYGVELPNRVSVVPIAGKPSAVFFQEQLAAGVV